ncbi:MAG: hypothetical protein ACXQTM_00650 [Methanosarcinales archaeon]
MSKEIADKIAVLSEDHDLSQDSDLELVAILKKLCAEYEMCRYCLSTATLDVWHGIVRVAKEIVKRETCSNSRDLIELAALVATELDYPEKWDTAVYTTVWEALWEDYSWVKAKLEMMKQRIKSACELYLKYKDNPMLLVRDWDDEWNTGFRDVFEFVDRFSYWTGKNKKAWKRKQYNEWLLNFAFSNVMRDE